MAYDSNADTDIGTLVWRFLDYVSGKVSDSGQDGACLDDEALWADVLTSFHTERDPHFKEEWAKILQDRKSAAYANGEDAAQDLNFRMREMKAMVRSMCRQGILTRLAAPKTTWEVGQ